MKELQTELSQLMHTQHAPSSSSSVRGRGIIADLERLTQRNAELSSVLASTQHARSSLEREVGATLMLLGWVVVTVANGMALLQVLAHKRSLLEVRGHCRKLEGELATSGEGLEAVCKERERLATCLQQQKHSNTQLAEENVSACAILDTVVHVQSVDTIVCLDTNTCVTTWT